MTCMTSMMRTNQERDHRSRFVHEVSGGATCDQGCQSSIQIQEYKKSIVPSITHYQQIDGRRCIEVEGGGWEGNGRGWKEVHRGGGVGRERERMEGGA